MIPSPFPLYVSQNQELQDGVEIKLSPFCKKAINSKQECLEHYHALAKKPEGFYQCPFGFTSRNFSFDGTQQIITGVIAFPRFGTENERQKGKQFPQNKTTRDSIEACIRFLREVETYKANAVQDAAQVLPQAFHELRKLNGAVLQYAEKEMADRGDTRNLRNIKGAAELMRNNFDILEALSNIEGMRALPTDSTINLFDLVFKMKRILQEKADSRSMGISVNGVRAIIYGSQKSFPIVPAVLLENAIKYGREDRVIHATIAAVNRRAILTVENETDRNIDPLRCFERGTRFTNSVEGGGFGLFLAREIVSAHNGTIRCEPNHRSIKMVVELPLHTVIPDR